MRVALATIVLNEAEMLPRCLEQHLGWPGLVRWVLVEGAAGWYGKAHPDAVTAEGLSVDRTGEILREAARSDDRVRYVQHGWSRGSEARLGAQKSVLRNRYCEVIDELDPPVDLLIVVDADEFYTRRDQERICEIVQGLPRRFDAFLFPQRHLWRPPALLGLPDGGPDGGPLRVVGGYWSVPHVRVWRYERGARYLLSNHNYLVLPSRGCYDPSPSRLYRHREGFGASPACIHLGFARDPLHRRRTNQYYVARGEGRETAERNRADYVRCRSAWETWQPGSVLPDGARVVPFRGDLPGVLKAEAVASVEGAPAGDVQAKDVRVGLVGYACPTGLGYENRRMWRGLAGQGARVDWLVWPHDRLGAAGVYGLTEGPGHRLDTSILTSRDEASATRALEDFLARIDVLVCAERPFPPDLFAWAGERGVRTVLLVNPEWRVGRTWEEADVVVARTAFAQRVVRQVTGRRDVRLVPCPLDLGHLPFSHRTSARRAVFSNGWGGVHDRKGWPTVRDLLRVAPGAPVTVLSQRALLDSPVSVCSSVSRPADLYAEADVTLVPSRFEGVGLAVLEAMASGLPVLTTDAPPMNEYVKAAYEDPDLVRHALLPVDHVELVPMWTRWRSNIVAPSALAEGMARLEAAPEVVSELSIRGRRYVERVHGESAFKALADALCAALCAALCTVREA